MKYRIGFAATTLYLIFATWAFAGVRYNVITGDDLLKTLQEKKPVNIVDIQKKSSFLLHHFFASLETDAYPVKTEKETGQIKKIIETLQKNTNPVIIVGPRGTRPSQRAYAYLAREGIDAQRLAILQKGVRGWPAPQILLNTSGQ